MERATSCNSSSPTPEFAPNPYSKAYSRWFPNLVHSKVVGLSLRNLGVMHDNNISHFKKLCSIVKAWVMIWDSENNFTLWLYLLKGIWESVCGRPVGQGQKRAEFPIFCFSFISFFSLQTSWRRKNENVHRNKRVKKQRQTELRSNCTL